MRISDWSSDVCSSDLIAAIGGPGVVERGRIDALGPQAAQIMGEQRTFPASPVDEVESGDQKIADVDRPGAEPRLRIEETRRSVRVDLEVAEVHVAMVDHARLRLLRLPHRGVGGAEARRVAQ